MTNMAVQLTPILEKGLVDPAIVHRVLCEYMENALPLAVVDAAESLSSSVMRVLHTREGAKAACYALAALTAKGRKKMLKTFKGNVLKIAMYVRLMSYFVFYFGGFILFFVCF